MNLYFSFAAPCQFYLTCLKSTVLDTLRAKHAGFDGWDLYHEERHFLAVFEAHKQSKTLVFLSRDSPNVLPDAEIMRQRGGDYVYIIGGLVDHNVHKGLTLEMAEKSGIQHARLPIDSAIKMVTSQVLAVNHVFELMLMVGNGVDWESAIKHVIPQRKCTKREKKFKKKPKKIDDPQETNQETHQETTDNQKRADDIVSDGLDSSEDDSEDGDEQLCEKDKCIQADQEIG